MVLRILISRGNIILSSFSVSINFHVVQFFDTSSITRFIVIATVKGVTDKYSSKTESNGGRSKQEAFFSSKKLKATTRMIIKRNLFLYNFHTHSVCKSKTSVIS